MFSVDTSTVVDFLRQPPAQLIRRFAEAQQAGLLAISSVVLFELSYGAERRRHPSHIDRLDAFLGGGVAVLDMDADDGWEAGRLRAELERIGRGIGPFDILIAGQALRRGLTLVTSNVGEFSRVPDLTVENWRE